MCCCWIRVGLVFIPCMLRATKEAVVGVSMMKVGTRLAPSPSRQPQALTGWLPTRVPESNPSELTNTRLLACLLACLLVGNLLLCMTLQGYPTLSPPLSFLLYLYLIPTLAIF